MDIGACGRCHYWFVIKCRCICFRNYSYGIISIPKGQTEAAYSIGMTYRQTIQRIILPQAIRVSIPALGNTFLSLIKDTSLLGFILVAEMFRKAQEVASTNI